MKPLKPLTLVFLQHAKGRGDVPADGEELEHLLAHAVDRGRQGRPFGLDDKVFVDYLAQRLPPAKEGVTLAQVFADMHLEDLYLAFACVHKVPEAIATLEKHQLSELRTWLKRTNSVVDEVCQSVRIQLLVGMTPAGPRLATYRGTSSLQHWIRVVASRLLPPGKPPSGNGSPPASLLSALENIPFQGPDSEIELIKRRAMDAFRQALSKALDGLPEEPRRLLRLYYIDHLTTIELGRIIGKDQSTASRKLALARETVYEETKRLLKEDLRLASKEFDSFVAAIQSNLDVSLSHFLGETDDEEDEK
jgi:RNA polymerase sigma-70 factor, ECF subfamily